MTAGLPRDGPSGLALGTSGSCQLVQYPAQAIMGLINYILTQLAGGWVNFCGFIPASFLIKSPALI